LRLGTAEMMKLSQQMGRRPRLAPFSFVMLPSMSISTEAKAKSLPARTGVTERTVIETMLDPVSLSWEPSIESTSIGGARHSLTRLLTISKNSRHAAIVPLLNPGLPDKNPEGGTRDAKPHR
jgi:hypothetical protein